MVSCRVVAQARGDWGLLEPWGQAQPFVARPCIAPIVAGDALGRQRHAGSRAGLDARFVVAKLSGMRVDEFGLGYPPRALVIAKKGETEYTLNWLPFGGFVVNRVLPAYLVRDPQPDPSRETGPDVALARKLATLRDRFAALVEAERAEIAQLERAAPEAPLVEIPLQTDEPTSLRSLALIAAALDA